jgi:hypothetical protein
MLAPKSTANVCAFTGLEQKEGSSNSDIGADLVFAVNLKCEILDCCSAGTMQDREEGGYVPDFTQGPNPDVPVILVA